MKAHHPSFALAALTLLLPAITFAQPPEEDPVVPEEEQVPPDEETPQEMVVVEEPPAEEEPPPAPLPAPTEVEEYETAEYDLEDRLLDLEERVDQVERRSLLDRIQFTGDYRMIFNAVIYTGPSPDPYDRTSPTDPVTRTIEETNAEIWSHRFRLGLSAEPIDSVRITGRLTMYKLFGNSQGPAFIQDSSSTRVPRDAGARFDTIWLDWFIADWLSLSGGRIAYAEGNPQELRENSTVRRATWGLHMVDGEYDTVNVTLNFSDYLEGFRTRLFYASWYNPNTTDVFGGFPFVSSGTDNLRIFGGNVELEIPGLGHNFVQLGYYIAPDFRPFQVPIPDPAFDPSADYTHAPAPLNGSLLFPADMPDSLGSYMNGSALLELYDLGGIGLDLFVSGSIGYLQPNGQGIAYDIPSDATDPNSPRVRFPFLFLASEGDDGLTYFAYAGLRYTFPIEVLNEPKIGFEYNYGSQYHISFAVQTDNLLTKLNTRGSAYEAYLILPVNEYLFFRAAYLFIDQDYAAGFFGPNPATFGSTAPDAPAEIHSFNLILNASI
jgi:hypothetical protein